MSLVAKEQATTKTLKMSTGWRPPTPPSALHALPPPPVNTTTFDPLPPPLTATFAVPQSTFDTAEFDARSQASGKALGRLLNEGETYYGTRTTPATQGGRRLSDAPERGYFPPHDINELYEARLIDTHSLAPPPRNASLPASQSSTPSASPRVSVTSTKHAQEEKKISPRKRPRREAAVPKSVPERELSPLDGDTTYGKPATTGSQSNRKVSHSLIERRRREKINECLASLKQMVPHCREEGERKEARAKERGRKRGKKVDDDKEEEGNRGGLHKLEILQGTILYVEELEAKIVALEAAAAAAPRHRQVLDLNNPSPPASQSRSFSPLSPVLDDRLVENALAFPTINNTHYSNHNFLTTAAAPPSNTTRPAEFDYHASNKLPPIRAYSYSSNSSAASSTMGGLLAPQRNGNSSISDLMSSRSNSGPSFIPDAEDHEAGLLLLKFSTSPELRPVFYD